MSSGKGRGYSLLAFFFFFVLFISSEVTAARKLKMHQNNEKGIVYLTPRTAIRNKPICDGSGPYSRCIPRSKPPKEKCNPYVRGCSLP
ncbi:uncharacterized protein LOC101208804 [Cucumis sativus]|uniref:Pathogen-induced protein CuPi1 n=1 Tax=Cucumis sativus TaxID=3659 RepID=O24512_CUCSA|nr:uncharacterized protein LOC101208804 [Cucumis sativus]AAB71340.1 pathogen-induced protein CuPi1 [Cucumis sativus]KGN43457.1 hypothetical protein Csa_020505 [Cucumis sativus]